MHRLVERLGRGGFAEGWRVRPEPARACAGRPDPAALARWLGTLTEALLVRDGAHAAARPVVRRAAKLVEAQGAAPAGDDARPALRGGVQATAREALGWAQALCATGDLDVALKVPFRDGYVRQMRREKHPAPRPAPAPGAAARPGPGERAAVPGHGAGARLEPARGAQDRAAPTHAKVLAVMGQLLTVLDHLHRRGMVHGGVKPEKRLLWEDLEAPDHALAKLARAAAAEPGRPEVLRALVAALALAGEPVSARALTGRAALADARLGALVGQHQEAHEGVVAARRRFAAEPTADTARELTWRARALERAGWAQRAAADTP